MNKQTILLLAGVLLGSLAARDAAAQAQPTNAPGARPVTRDRTDYWAQRLNLTAEQREKVKPILEEEAQKFADLRKHPELKPEERRAKYMAIREETSAKLKPVLTPEQWEKYSRPLMAQTNLPPVRLTNAPVGKPVPEKPAK